MTRIAVTLLLFLFSLPLFAAENLSDLEDDIDDLVHEVIVRFENGVLAPYQLQETTENLLIDVERYTRKGGNNTALIKSANEVIKAGKWVISRQAKCKAMNQLSQNTEASNSDQFSGLANCLQELAQFVTAWIKYPPEVDTPLNTAAQILKEPSSIP